MASQRRLGITARDVPSATLLVIGAVVLGLAAASVWVAAINPAEVGCHNAPLKIVRVPQLAGIGVCLVGFIIGRLTGRASISSRLALNTALVPSGTEPSHVRLAILTQFSLTLALLFIACLVTYETVTLADGVWPITYYMRCANEAGTWQTLVAAFFFCALVGRWLWLPRVAVDTD